MNWELSGYLILPPDMLPYVNNFIYCLQGSINKSQANNQAIYKIVNIIGVLPLKSAYKLNSMSDFLVLL